MQSSPFYCWGPKKLRQSEPPDKAGKWLDRIWTPVAQTRSMGDCWQQTGPSISWVFRSFPSSLPLRDSVNFHNNAGRDRCLLCPIFQLKRLRHRALHTLLPSGRMLWGVALEPEVVPFHDFALCCVFSKPLASTQHTSMKLLHDASPIPPRVTCVCLVGGEWGAVVSMGCPPS